MELLTKSIEHDDHKQDDNSDKKELFSKERHPKKAIEHKEEWSFVESEKVRDNIAYQHQYLEFMIFLYNDYQIYLTVESLLCKNIMVTIASIIESALFDLVEQAPRLTRVTDSNRIIQSAVALGGTNNIPRFFDIFSSIMLQNGVNAEGKRFNPLENNESAARLAQAFNFYTDFARPGKASYSWNADAEDALEMFASGRLAYLFGYSYHADQLRARNLQFDWDIKNFPQTRGATGTKYYADYWVNVVAKKSKNQDAAWNFIQSTAAADKVKIYLDANKRPTALRSLIDEQLNDYEVRTFASQVLTASNWYNGYNIALAEQYTAEIIDALVSGELVMDKEATPISLFINKINQTYVPPSN